MYILDRADLFSGSVLWYSRHDSRELRETV